jgi:tetratricopeptide (TPR) repeat protein
VAGNGNRCSDCLILGRREWEVVDQALEILSVRLLSSRWRLILPGVGRVRGAKEQVEGEHRIAAVHRPLGSTNRRSHPKGRGASVRLLDGLYGQFDDRGKVMKICAAMNVDGEGRMLESTIEHLLPWADLILIAASSKAESSVAAIRTGRGGAGSEGRPVATIVVRPFEGSDHQGIAWDFLLHQAHLQGADGVLLMKPQERLEGTPAGIRQQLHQQLQEARSTQVWRLWSTCNQQAEERFFRLPVHTQLRWMGAIDSWLEGGEAFDSGELDEIRLISATDSFADRAEVFRRELRLLEDCLQSEPRNYQYWHALGKRYRHLGNREEALVAFKQAVLVGVAGREVVAASALNGAGVAIEMGDYQTALEVCCLGLACCPDWSELFWTAGYCCYYLGRYPESILWENFAVSLGHYRGLATGQHRKHHRQLLGWFDGPYEVLQYALERQGQSQEARQAGSLRQQARSARLAFSQQAVDSPRPARVTR